MEIKFAAVFDLDVVIWLEKQMYIGLQEMKNLTDGWKTERRKPWHASVVRFMCLLHATTVS
jgi:hypothetical protein